LPGLPELGSPGPLRLCGFYRKIPPEALSPSGGAFSRRAVLTRASAIAEAGLPKDRTMNRLSMAWRNRFSSVRGKRVIVGNFFLLALVSLLSAAMFYFFVDSIYKRNAERNLYVSSMSMLTRLGDTMDIYFANLAQMMDIAMRNKDFISATVTPNVSHYERNKSIITYLASLAAGNELIKNAYYYVGETGYVYTSEGLMVQLDQFAFGDAVGDVLRHAGAKGARGTVSGLDVAHAGDNFFVLRDFFTVRRLGTMFFEVDTAMLSARINGRTPRHSGGVYAYDAALQPLFPSRGYPPIAREELAAALEKSRSRPVKLRGVSYYRHVDPNSGWLYLLPFFQDYSLGQKLALGVIIPFLFFFLLFNLAVFLYSTLSVYRPVNEIINSITRSADAAPSPQDTGNAGNEFDFIKTAFNNVVGANEQYETLLGKFAPGVQERLFSMLLSGREAAPGHVQDMLAGIRSPFAASDRFLTLVFKLDWPADRKSELEADMTKAALEAALAARVPEELHLFWFLGRNDDIVAVAGFRAEAAPLQPARFLAAVDACARECGAKTPWNLFWGCGEVYNDILDIAYSYGEAVKSLRVKQYADTDSRTPEEAEELALSVSVESIMEKQMDNIWRHIMEKDLPQAQSAALRLVEENAGNGGNGFAVLTNVFVKCLVDMQISPEDLAETERMMVRPASGTALPGARHEDAAAMREFVLHCIAMLDRYNRKRQNKYILGAVEYISEHYSDSDLSLNSVSEYLGIHSTYLSRLFNDAGNKSFTTVLNEYRIETAQQLLHLTTQSVADIGFKTGFNSAQNFIRVFKKHTGMTPGQYREQRV